MNRYGLIGKSLSHSFSKSYFTEKFKAFEIQAEYINIELESIEDFRMVFHQYPQLKGINVTIPYKTEVIPFLQHLSPEAEKIQAVNCIKVDIDIDNVHLSGFNTDYIGVVESLKSLILPSNIQALVLGKGGASKGVQYALNTLDIPFLLATREDGFGLHYDQITPEIMHDFKLIINTTPLGTYPNIQELPPIPIESLSAQHVVFDLVYNPSETLLIKTAKAKGAQAINGLNMLHVQAEESWKIWNS